MGNHKSGKQLSLAVVMRAERLLRFSSAGSVARELAIDEGTVAKIARGKHPQQKRRRSLIRCPGCGGLVEAPCRLCAARLSRGPDDREDAGALVLRKR